MPNSPKIINNLILKSITHSNDSILELQKKMFPNVCKHYLVIYGCIKFTFKKVGRMLINYFQVLPVSVRDTFPPNWIQLYLAWHVLKVS